MAGKLAAVDIACGFVFAATLAGVLFTNATTSNFWAGTAYDPGQCLLCSLGCALMSCVSLTGPWCERERTSWFLREPANALSDFSFFAVGLGMIRFGVLDLARSSSSSFGVTRNLFVDFPWLSILNGLVNIFHAVGTFRQANSCRAQRGSVRCALIPFPSCSNHSCRCNGGHRLDVTGMLSTVFFLVVFNLARLLSLCVGSTTSQVAYTQCARCVTLSYKRSHPRHSPLS